uniref:Uncharacterized protein n=1 Tax=Ciona savignyi TaxID=51511 RepID=H2Z3G7_CIOSA
MRRLRRKFDFSDDESVGENMDEPISSSPTNDNQATAPNNDEDLPDSVSSSIDPEHATNQMDVSSARSERPAKKTPTKRRFLWDVDGEALTWDDSFLLTPRSAKRKSLSLTSLSFKSKKRKWLDWERENLLDGVRRFGMGQWSMILSHFKFQNRTAIMLKDKWRTMQQNRSIPEDLR